MKNPYNFKYLEMIKADNNIEGTPIKKDEIVLYLGEIFNMKGHIAFEYKGLIFYGYHPENFRKIKQEEL